MEKDFPRRWDRKFIYVAVACLLGALGASILLWRDFNQSGAAGQGPPMGKVEHRESKVRRKAKSSYVWDKVQVGESVYLKDSIQTGSKAAAAVRLSDGTLLELGENSLIVIDEAGKLSLNLRGQVVLRNSSGDTRISVGADGQAKIEELPVRLTKPASLARIFSANRGAVEVAFAWEPRAGGKAAKLPEKFTIQISGDARFGARGTKTLSTPDSKTLSVSAKLDQGHYYWRVLDGETPLTEAGQFWLTLVEPLKPVSPNPREKAVVIGREAALQFRWGVATDSDSSESAQSEGEHVIEISRDENFKNVVLTEKVSAATGTAILKGVPTGPLFWRLKSKYGDLVVRSKPEPFNAEAQAQLAIELGAPEEQWTTPVRPALRFTWSSNSTDLDYLWELETLEGKPQHSKRLRAQSIEWKGPVPGLYRWRVLGYLDGQKQAESSWRTLSVHEGNPIQLKGPARDQKILFWETPPPFAFEWEQDEIARNDKMSFELEVSKDPEFKQILATARTRSNKLESNKLKLELGPLFWRVRVVDQNHHVIKASPEVGFVYDHYPHLRAPASQAPEPSRIFNLLELETAPMATWAAVEGAVGYEVTIHDAATGQVALQATTKEPSVSLSPLKPGNYVWKVQAIDRIRRPGEPTEARGFSVIQGDPLPAPEMTTPEVQ